MIVFDGDRTVMYILIGLQRMDEEEMETLISQWVGALFDLKKGVLGVLCCFGGELQLLEVEICPESPALVFRCNIENGQTLEAVISRGISFSCPPLR